MYSLPLGNIFRKYGIHFHSNADDNQLYLSSKPSKYFPPPSFTRRLAEIIDWISANFLKLNSDKTEVLLIGTKSTLTKSNCFTVDFDNNAICPSQQFRSLSVILDSTLSFESHVNNNSLHNFKSRLKTYLFTQALLRLALINCYYYCSYKPLLYL